jgi:hypothetical protein
VTTRLRTALNRTVLGAIGLALLLAGVRLAATGRDVTPRLPSWWPAPAAGSALLDRDALARLHGEAWWTPTALSATAALTVLFAWWALAQFRSGRARRLALPSSGCTVRTSALAEALSTRAASLPGVARCRAQALPYAEGRLEIVLRVWLEPDSPPDAVLPGLRTLTAEAERSAAPRVIRTRIRLSAAPHRTPRVR